MKRVAYILMSITLSITIFFVGAGVNVVYCTHSGVIDVMMGEHSHCCKSDCGEQSDCMIVEHMELSPTVVSQSQDYDLQVFQPLISFFIDTLGQWLLPATIKSTERHSYEPYISPPRCYLNSIRVLLI